MTEKPVDLRCARCHEANWPAARVRDRTTGDWLCVSCWQREQEDRRRD